MNTATGPYVDRGAWSRTGAVVLGLLAGSSALAVAQQSELKVGYIATLSGTMAVVGEHVLDGLMFGIEEHGGKLGGLRTTVIKEDDQLKPDVGLQAASRLMERERVDIIVGPFFSNVMLATYRPVTGNKTIMISPVAGPSPVAGKQCSPYFFSTSWQNDQPHEAMGQYLSDKGVKTAYILAPNYQAGKDTLNGFKRRFTGKIVGEVYTGLSQLDFAAEIAQIRFTNPEAVYVFYPGGYSINFVKQYAQTIGAKIPLYSASSIDDTNIAAIGDAALGTFQTASWNYDFDNPANVRFREAFARRYGYKPSFYAAYGYDAAQLLNAAIGAVGGKVSDKPALIAAMEKADFNSVRGKFRYNKNHFGIQDFYLLEVVKGADGKMEQVSRQPVLRDHEDPYVSECTMPPP